MPDLPRMVSSVVEPYLLDGPRRYNRREVAERSGVPMELARRLWVSLGFPANPDDDAVEFTDADVAALRELKSLNFTRESDTKLQIAAARTLGQSMARLAEWQVDLVTHELDAATDADEALKAIAVIRDLQIYTWQRHLAAALARAAETESGSTRTLAVGFADMVGYTRLTRHLAPDELSALLEAFETTTTETITSHGGWAIKNVGDEVMFAADTPEVGARIALALQDAIRTVPETPELRIGLAYGPVLARFGDLFGSVVNMAARLTGIARPGTVLLDDMAAAALDSDPAFTIKHLRSVRVKGINRLRSHVLRESV